MTDKLKEIFENVNNWLSFAEAKNAALVALESTIIIGFITSDIFKTYTMFISIIICICSFALLISLYSFIPSIGNKTNKIIQYLVKLDKQNISKNMILFSYIAQYEEDQEGIKKYLEDIKREYEISCEIKQEHKDLAGEIIYNSKLAVKKYKLFGFSLKIILGLIFVLIIGIIIA